MIIKCQLSINGFKGKVRIHLMNKENRLKMECNAYAQHQICFPRNTKIPQLNNAIGCQCKWCKSFLSLSGVS